MKFQSSLVKELEFVREEEGPSERFSTNLILGVEDPVEGGTAFLASTEMANRTVLSKIVFMT